MTESITKTLSARSAWRGAAAREFQVVTEAGDAAIVSLYGGDNGYRFGTNDRCCRLGDGGANVCPKNPIILNTSYHAIVLHPPYVYFLPDNELLRGKIGSPNDASTVIRDGLGEVVGSLAVDDTDAYLGVGNRILRVALPAP